MQPLTDRSTGDHKSRSDQRAPGALQHGPDRPPVCRRAHALPLPARRQRLPAPLRLAERATLTACECRRLEQWVGAHPQHGVLGVLGYRGRVHVAREDAACFTLAASSRCSVALNLPPTPIVA